MSRHLHRMLEEEQMRLRQQGNIERPSIDEKEYQSTGDALKMKWKKIDFLDSIGKWVYSDKYGYCQYRLESFAITIPKMSDGRTQVGSHELYVYTGDGNCKRLANIGIDLTKIFSYKYGVRKDYNYGYGGLPEVVSESYVKELTTKEFDLYFRLSYWVQPNSSNERNLQMKAKKLEDLNNEKFYYNPEYNGQTFKNILMSDLTEGKKLYLVGVGTVEVEKLYDYPSRDTLICLIKDLSGRTRKVFYNGQTDDGLTVLELPMDTKEKETALFNDSKNELLLQPFVINEGQTYNVYWQGLEEAAQYVVELYKIIGNQTKKNVYHLNDYYVDRNTTFLQFTNLVGKNFVFVVRAENRDGEILAFSRGISNGEPMWW